MGLIDHQYPEGKDSRKAYSDVGVDYDKLDPVKEMALELFEPTLKYPEKRLGIKILGTGLTACPFDLPKTLQGARIVLNVEGLGTKNKIADEVYKVDKELAYRGYTCVGQCTTAMSVNDQAGIGADTIVYGDIAAAGVDKWFDDHRRCKALLQGFRNAADQGQFAIPLGETPALREIIYPDTLDLCGASVGIIQPPERYTDGSRIREGDVIFGISTPGPNANGITKIRRIADCLKDGYFTKMDDDSTFFDGVMVPTPIYSRVIMDMFNKSVDIHMLQPITGHGWAKIARAKANWTYKIKNVPEPLLVFRKLVEWGEDNFDFTNEENYKVWNMGVGFVVIAPEEYKDTISGCAKSHGFEAHYLGNVEKGDRKVLMEPFGFAYTPK